ncbi:hypothetical protein D3C76_1376120 [compost metagenome]
MYQTKIDVLEALRSGKLLPKICQQYSHNKNLSDERRKMFRVALISYRIEQLQEILRNEEQPNEHPIHR